MADRTAANDKPTGENMNSGKSTQSKQILAGGLIIIALGVLIYLHTATQYNFGKSWPILLIVIAVGTLMQRLKDLGGWIIGTVGVIFLLREMFDVDFSIVGMYVLPLLLIILGVMVVMKHFRKRA